MPTLIYAPSVAVYIDTIREGRVDVSADIESGSVNRVLNTVSTADLTLANPNRKYDNLFTPNDRIVIFLKRIRWVQVFAGYLNTVPYRSLVPRSVNLSASCTLKKPQYHFWDPGTPASVDIVRQDRAFESEQDGGMKTRAERLLTKVVGWDPRKIHIGAVPDKWMEHVTAIQNSVEESEYLTNAIGAAPTIGGGSPYRLSTETDDGIEANAALLALRSKGVIGSIPKTSGLASFFGGPEDASTRNGTMALTGESGYSPGVPGDPDGRWYCAMRFPYVQSLPDRNRTHVVRDDISSAELNAAVSWWRNRKVYVYCPQTNRAVVLRCADWGPAEWTGRTIDMAKHALYQGLGASTDATVHIGFAPQDAPLGPASVAPLQVNGGVPATAVDPYGTGEGRGTSNTSTGTVRSPGSGDDPALSGMPDYARAAESVPIPAAIAPGTNPSKGDFAWGGFSNGRIPLDRMTKTSLSGGRNTTNYAHPIAAIALEAMKEAAARDGVRIDGSCYRTYAGQVAVAGPKAATPGSSNHGWGFAFDFATGGQGFNSNVYKWLVANGWRFGFVHPLWARPGGSNPESWHWEFWGIFNYQRAGGDLAVRPGQFSSSVSGGSGGGSVQIDGSTRVSVGGDAAVGTEGSVGMDQQGSTLFNFWRWGSQIQQGLSTVLTGQRALMNDTEVLPSLAEMMSASMRDFCSAPNGDFIAWFPDYFGLYGTAGKFVIRDIELNDFTINWSDARLKTHFFVIGALMGAGPIDGSTAGSFLQDPHAQLNTEGIASVELPHILQSILGLPEVAAFGQRDAILRRFGARPHTERKSTIQQGPAEFFFAIKNFMSNWASQFSTSIPTTFLPEIWPGMLAQMPDHDLQVYVESVTHRFGVNGYSTSLGVTAPSHLDGTGLLGLAREAEYRGFSASSGVDLATAGGTGPEAAQEGDDQ